MSRENGPSPGEGVEQHRERGPEREPEVGQGSSPRRDLRGWDDLVERRIREAMDAGEFDDLPFRGEPLPPDDTGAWGVAGRILRRAGVAPPWIETDKAIRALLEERDAIVERAARASPLGRRRDREATSRIFEAVNALAARLETEAPTPAQHRRRLDLRTELARLDAAAQGNAPGTAADRADADPP